VLWVPGFSLLGHSGAVEYGVRKFATPRLSIPRLASARSTNRIVEVGEVRKILQAMLIQIH